MTEAYFASLLEQHVSNLVKPWNRNAEPFLIHFAWNLRGLNPAIKIVSEGHAKFVLNNADIIPVAYRVFNVPIPSGSKLFRVTAETGGNGENALELHGKRVLITGRYVADWWKPEPYEKGLWNAEGKQRA